MEKKITIHDIARLMELSPSTISRALSDNPRISNITRERVRAIASEHGYQQNSMASSLRKGFSMTLGVIVPRINRNFFSQIIGSLEAVLNDAGYNLIICQSQEEYEKERSSIQTLINMRVNSVFISLATGSVSTAHLKEMIAKGTRFFMFDRIDESLPVPSVRINDYKGALDTVNHLLEQGYQRIYHFAGPDHLSVYHDRKAGYLDALAAAGMKPDHNWIIPDTLTKEKGSNALHKIMLQGKKPDAIFAASDFSALGAHLAARELNIALPGELGIAGFGNELFTGFLNPGLTTTNQKPEEIGRSMAIAYLEGKTRGRIVIEPELIIRRSTLKNA
jgi:LacI family transcriptional regulator